MKVRMSVRMSVRLRVKWRGVGRGGIDKGSAGKVKKMKPDSSLGG